MSSWHGLYYSNAKKFWVGNEIQMTLFEMCHLIQGKLWVWFDMIKIIPKDKTDFLTIQFYY